MSTFSGRNVPINLHCSEFSNARRSGKENPRPMEIKPALTGTEIRNCFPVMQQLRQHLDLPRFVEQVENQMRNAGYVLAYLDEDGEIKAAIGYRVTSFLAWGRVFYIDDLITDGANRGKGYAGALLDWAFAKAREAQCDQVHLDSGFQRHEAHRLYLNKKMRLASHHFSIGVAGA